MFFAKNNFEYLIAGLGNPTKKYENTRHNVGFDALDAVAECFKIDVKKAKFSALYGTGEIDGVKVALLKPQTFMNLSGESVGAASKFYKIAPQKVIVLFDDISLAPGIIRIRKKGSAGGHNGLKSIISHIGDEFLRIKIGVGEKPHADYDLADWVLSKPSAQEAASIKSRHGDICKAIALMVGGDIDKATNLYSK